MVQVVWLGFVNTYSLSGSIAWFDNVQFLKFYGVVLSYVQFFRFYGFVLCAYSLLGAMACDCQCVHFFHVLKAWVCQ